MKNIPHVLDDLGSPDGDDIEKLREDRELLLAEIAELRREKMQQLHALRRLEYDERELRNSVSFRLGHALVLGFKSPARLLRMPADVVRLYREGRAKRPHRARARSEEERYG